MALSSLMPPTDGREQRSRTGARRLSESMPGRRAPDRCKKPGNYSVDKGSVAMAAKFQLGTIEKKSRRNELEAERGRASIYEVDPKSGAMREFASGLRNPNGLTFEPTTKALWAVINERDELGNDLVPDT